MIATGGGRFDPDDRPLYFLAGQGIVDPHLDVIHRHWLVALNETLTAGGREKFERRMNAAEATIMLDSGVFVLVVDHAERHGLSVPEAFATPPDELDGFDALAAAYADTVRQHEHQLWGYVEFDVGGADAKRENRQRMEAEGLHPIPVYHPLTDPWSYLDELLEGYDRVCVGGIARATSSERRALLAMVWDRRRRFGRGRWLHALGVSPQDLLTSLPYESCDAATWVFNVRFGMKSGQGARAMGGNLGGFSDADYTYDRDGDRESRILGQRFIVMDSRFQRDVWRRHEADYEREVGSLVPPPAAGEKPIGRDPAG